MRISACMIVKNEEDQIERCLNSVKDYFDEIIVVDTGSTDNTVEIVKKYTDKIYFHKWTGDFSKSRNQSIDYATGDWIFIIDADEEFVCEVKKEDLYEVLEDVPDNINTLSITMDDIQRNIVVMSCNSARIFRKGKIVYKGRVHNQPSIEGGSAILGGLKILHYGYDLSPEKMQAKYERTSHLLMKQFENNENPHVEFYLCQLNGQHKKTKELQEWGEKYLAKRDKLGVSLNQTIYFTLTKSYIDSGNMKRAWEIINEFLQLKKPDPDMALAISDFGAKEGRLDIIATGCRKYLQDREYFETNKEKMGGKFFFSLRDDVKRLILYRLCMVCFNEGITTFNLIKNDLDKFDNNTRNELIKNMEKLGLSFLIKEDEDYKLPKLRAV